MHVRQKKFFQESLLVSEIAQDANNLVDPFQENAKYPLRAEMRILLSVFLKLQDVLLLAVYLVLNWHHSFSFIIMHNYYYAAYSRSQ